MSAEIPTKADVLIWTPTAENPALGACVLTWARDGSTLATYGFRSKAGAERLAERNGWAFRVAT